MRKSFIIPDIQTCRRRLVFIRPVFWITAGFGFGIWISRAFPFSFFPVLALTFLTLCVSCFYMRKPFFFLLGFLVFFCSGILFGVNSRTFHRHDLAHSAAEGWMTLEGKVVSVPEKTLKGKKETLSFILSADNFFQNGRIVQIQGKVQTFLHNTGREIHFGDELRLRGKLERPKRATNPYIFDYAGYLAGNGIYKVFRGIGKKSVVRQIENQKYALLPLLNRFRVYLRERVQMLFPSPHRELAEALLLGFRKNVPRHIKDAFIKTGTAHLLAISGLHVALIGGLFYFSLGFLSIPRPFRLASTAIFIAGYAVLAGANPPVLRAGMMGIIVLTGFLLERDRHIKSALFLAFSVLLIADPKLLFGASFQLSFVATASLIFILPLLERAQFHSRREQKARYFVRQNIGGRLGRFMVQTLLTSFSVTVGMFPLLIWYFNQFSFTSFLANAFAIPVCTLGIWAALLVLSLELTGFPFTRLFVFFPIAFFDLELKIVRWFSEIPFGYFYLPKPGWMFFACYYGFLMAWIIFSNYAVIPKWRRACLGGLILTVTTFLLSSHPPKSRLLFFDLGKTDAALISFSNGARFLINTGRHFPSDQAYWILRPYFMASGIQKIDGLLLVKPDAAHAGGFKTLINHVHIRDVWIPRGADQKKSDRYVRPSFSKRTVMTPVSEGDDICSGSNRESCIHILAVRNGEIGAFLISDGNYKMLYVSSSRKETFETLVSHDTISFDIVFLPHHDFGISKAEKSFLAKLLTRYLILNQRDRLDQVRSEITSFVSAPVLSIFEMGAIELSFQENMTYRTFLKPDSDELLMVY